MQRLGVPRLFCFIETVEAAYIHHLVLLLSSKFVTFHSIIVEQYCSNFVIQQQQSCRKQ